MTLKLGWINAYHTDTTTTIRMANGHWTMYITSIAFHLLSTTHCKRTPNEAFLFGCCCCFFFVSFGMFRISNDHCDTVISRVAHAVLFCLNWLCRFVIVVVVFLKKHLLLTVWLLVVVLLVGCFLFGFLHICIFDCIIYSSFTLVWL